MTNEKRVSFKDFQRILKENEGKPIYKKTNNKYILQWTAGTFVYYTEVGFEQIYKSYFNQTKQRNDKAALEKFYDYYLKDTFEIRNANDSKEEIPLFMPPDSLRNEEEKPEQRWKYREILPLDQVVSGSLWTEHTEDSQIKIKGLSHEYAVLTVGVLEMSVSGVGSFALQTDTVQIKLDPKEIEKRIKELEARVLKEKSIYGNGQSSEKANS